MVPRYNRPGNGAAIKGAARSAGRCVPTIAEVSREPFIDFAASAGKPESIFGPMHQTVEEDFFLRVRRRLFLAVSCAQDMRKGPRARAQGRMGAQIKGRKHPRGGASLKIKQMRILLFSRHSSQMFFVLTIEIESIFSHCKSIATSRWRKVGTMKFAMATS